MGNTGMVITAYMAGSTTRRDKDLTGSGMEKELTVRDVMSSPVVNVLPDTPVKAVAELLLSERVSAVPVVDTHGHLLGIVSDADILLKQVDLPAGAHVPWLSGGHFSHDFRRRREALTAEQLMSTPVVCAHPDTTLRQAAKTMCLRHVKRLPVVDGSSLVGIVSRSDLLRVYLLPDEQLKRRAEHVLRGVLALSGGEVKVAVREGVVTLAGAVGTRCEAELLARLLARLEGVVGIESKLTWRVDDRVSPQARHSTLS